MRNGAENQQKKLFQSCVAYCSWVDIMIDKWKKQLFMVSKLYSKTVFNNNIHICILHIYSALVGVPSD